MSSRNLHRAVAVLALVTLFPGCVSTPTLVQTARKRQLGDKNAITGEYKITDRDVLDFSDQIKRKLSARFDRDRAIRYSASTGQLTLGALAGSVKTFGWSAGTAGALGTAATYIFGLGQIFDSKGHAQAYEHAFTDVEKAEATYFFYQVGMKFRKEGDRFIVDPETRGFSKAGIPSNQVLTADGQSLFYRVTKILKVLDDVLANIIPDLQDLKDAEGDKGAGTASPAK
jgi:hypothetical protein